MPSGKRIILKLVPYFARKIVIFDIPHPYVTEFPIIEHMNMSFQAVDKQWSCMTTIFKNWIKNATGLNFSWNMTQGSNKMGSKLIDIKEARCRCLLKWNVKVTLTKHVYLKSKRGRTHCFLFKVNALFVKKKFENFQTISASKN